MKPFVTLNELEYFNPFEGIKAKVVQTKTQTFAFWEIDKGTVLPKHKHMHEQVSFVTQGELELTIGGETRILRNGMFAYISPNTDHSARAITKVELTDVFTPPREDFIP